MKVLYHLSTLPPKIPQAEAIAQEIAILQSRFKGDIAWVNPNQQSPLPIPRLLFGYHKLNHLRNIEARFDLHHFYNPDPFPFPYLRHLKRPVIYSITCGAGKKRPNLSYFSSLAAIAVTDERSLKRMAGWGFTNVYRVKPGIDTTRFTHTPLPPGAEIRLLVGSAPWTKTQFKSKGVTALLDAAKQEPRLHLVFLWRGVLANEMERRVRALNLGKQVTVINKLVDVNQVLATVHAAIVLATQEGIVKAYPHSLLDSLASGKPALVSRAIPMADYVEQTGCGVVVETMRVEHILHAVETLMSNYPTIQVAAVERGEQNFSLAEMITSYQKVYEYVAKHA